MVTVADGDTTGDMHTPHALIDAAVATVADQAHAWTATDPQVRAALLRTLIDSTLKVAPDWVAASAAQPHLGTTLAEAWINEIAPLVRTMAVLATSYEQIAASGRPMPPAVGVGTDGRVHVDLLPVTPRDRALFPGITATARLAADVDVDDIYATLDARLAATANGAAVVLGAGNIASIAPLDIIHQLFVDNHPVVCKVHPRLAYLGPLLGAALEPLVERNLLRIIYGDAATAAHALGHSRLSAVHVTGSQATFDSIRDQLAQRSDASDIAVTAELGNVTPIIVVPGPWTQRDLVRQGRRIAAMVANNGAYNCVAPRLVVQHRAWASRRQLAHAIVRGFADVPTRPPYDATSLERWHALVDARQRVDRIEPETTGHMPYAYIHDLDPSNVDEPLFIEEVFSGIVGGVDLDAPRSIPAFLDAAVAWCNNQVFGSLAAIVLVHPRTLADAGVAVAVERAIRTLDYGVVSVNTFPGVAFALGSAPWGSHPDDRTAPTGWVHNGLLLDNIDNVVVRGRFNDPLVAAWSPRVRGREIAGPALAQLLAGRNVRQLAKPARRLVDLIAT